MEQNGEPAEQGDHGDVAHARADAAAKRAVVARERAAEAQREADAAGTPEAAERFRLEALMHERAADLHESAVEIQLEHERHVRGQ
jgi:hypothetical protein